MRIRYSFSSRHTGNIAHITKQREKYPKLVKDIIKISDIVLEVLDARFIEETRNAELESLIKKLGKELIYVLNKCDLVNTKEVERKIELHNLLPYVFVSCKSRVGAGKLRERIKIEAKKLRLEDKRVQVGIIGYPNTGKSSLINLLVGRSSARTGKEAGFTKGMQKIKLVKGILIIDTPGVIPETEYSGTEKKAMSKHAKIGVRTYDKVKDPEMIVDDLIKAYPKEFEKFYGIEFNEDSEVLIEEIGKRKNFVKKGNLVDEDRAARSILKDWQDGKIKI